nr:hypothetical protein [Tanacetum cinerariifolium]
MMKSSPIFLLSKASKTKSWLWHRRLNHLNFGTINDRARKDLVKGLPRLKFEKDHLCSACQLGKSKKHTHLPKTKNINLEVLNTLYMDLCEPVRVQIINGKKHILVIVDDYTWFTWVKFLRSKDETPEYRTAPTFLTPGQISSGLVPNLVPVAPYVPPTNKELEILFQPVFDEYLEPPRVKRLVFPALAVPVPVNSAGTPASTFIDQDAPSLSHSSSSSALQSPCLHQGVVAESTLMDENPFAPVDNNPFINIFAPEPNSEASPSGDASSAESTYVTQTFHHLGKWSKDHPIDYVIGNLSRPVSTRKQLATDALWEIFLQRADLKEHTIAEKDYKNLYLSDFKELNLLLLQGWEAAGYEFKHYYTIIESPRAVVFPVNNNKQRIMRFNEIYKFSDDTLMRTLEALAYRVKEFKIKRLNSGMNTRFWTQKDVTRSKEFIATIERRLETRRIYRYLECFVDGRVRDIDYRLLQITE